MVNRVNIEDFFEVLETMIGSGLNLTEALDVLAKSRNKSLSKVAKDGLKAVRGGKSLSDGLKKYLPLDEYSLLALQERSGDLLDGIRRLKRLREVKRQARNTFIASIAYPVFILAFLVGMLYVLGGKISTELVGIIGQQKFSQTPLYIYYQLSRPHNLGMLVFSIVMPFVLLFLFIFKANGEYRRVLDRYFPFSIYRSFQGIVFLITLSALMKSGFNITSAIEEIMRSNKYLRIMLMPIKRKMEGSENLGSAMLKTGIYLPDERTAEILSVVSMFTGLEEKLEFLAEKKIKSIISSISLAGKVLQILALLLAGLVVAGFVLGMQSTLSSIAGQIGR
ncbi:MAG: type II secretion system F family protein [Nitrososphaerota archaeon]